MVQCQVAIYAIHETTEFLEVFFRNLLLSENHPLHNRTLHISGTFKEPEKANIGEEKANIGEEKANIGEEKVNIEEVFTAKTAFHVPAVLFCAVKGGSSLPQTKISAIFKALLRFFL